MTDPKPANIVAYQADQRRFAENTDIKRFNDGSIPAVEWQNFLLWQIAGALESLVDAGRALVDVEAARGVEEAEPPEPWKGDPWDIKIGDDDDTDDEV